MRALMKHLLFVMALAVVASTANAAIDPAKVQKLLADDGAAYDSFGQSVAVSLDTAVIGAYGDDGESGSAYVFVRAADGKWSQKDKLTAADWTSSSEFGRNVAVFGDTAVIGAQRAGCAYVFVRAENGTWSQQAKLTAADVAHTDWFGGSVAMMSSDTVLIGAWGDNNASGSVYVFVRAADGNWSQKVKLIAADRVINNDWQNNAWFGWSMAVSGDTALIGDHGHDKGRNSGSVYVFVRAEDGTWTQQAKLIAADGGDNDEFGNSVAISGDTAVIGAPGDDDKGANSGSVYIFVPAADGTWRQHDKITAADGTAGDAFGRSVAISGDTAVIGADKDDDRKGSAYVFSRWAANCTWSQQVKLTPNDRATDDWFGNSVAVSGDTAVIGSPGDDDKGDASGSAYIYGSTAVRP